jgi:hypothetical protein
MLDSLATPAATGATTAQRVAGVGATAASAVSIEG